MRLRLLLVSLALATAATTPAGAAPPNNGLPGCGGYWAGSASCPFFPPLSLPIAFGGFATYVDIATVTVTVRLGAPNGPVLGSCTATGPQVTACGGQTVAAVPGLPHFCEVSGLVEGGYACIQDP